MSASRTFAQRGTPLLRLILPCVVALMCFLAGPAVGSAAAAPQPPVNVGEPEVEVVKGLHVGERLICYSGSWEHVAGGTPFTYKWFREGVKIGEGNPHFIVAADAGTYIMCKVTAINSEKPPLSVEEESWNSVFIPGVPGTKPKNTVRPEVSGKPALKETLTCSQGTWTGTPTPEYRYAWLRGGSEIEGAKSSTHVVVELDEGQTIECKVTALNGVGSEAAVSKNGLKVPGVEPFNKEVPKILGSETPVVGETLTCSTGVWGGLPAPAYNYQWVREVSGATTALSIAPKYTIVEADETHSIYCEVTATNSEGHASAKSKSRRVSGSRPVNVKLPEVSGAAGGTALLGSTLTCSPGEWQGQPPPTFAYQWLRNGSSIALATTSTYKVVGEDEAHSLSCAVTASNGEGSPASATSKSVSVGGSKPVNKQAPAISGEAVVGKTLTCSSGEWSGLPTPTFEYQWWRESTSIPSATASAYTILEADETHSLYCKVIAKNVVGSSEASSPAVKVPGSKPVPTRAPEVSGTPSVGSTLTCSQGTWTGVPAPEFAYQWLRNGLAIASALTSSYVVVEADGGQAISCQVTAANSLGSGSAVSKAVTVSGSAPKNTQSPSVTGTPAVGATLTCSPGTWSGNPVPTLSYQWLRDGTPIPFATASAYVVAEGDETHLLSCGVTGRNTQGSEEATSVTLKVPGSAPQPTKSPEISGTPSLGAVLTCSPGTWSGVPAPTFLFHWLREGVPIPLATKSTYTVAEGDVGHYLSCEVTGRSSEGEAAALSQSVRSPGTRPEVVKAPVVSGTPVVGGTLTCAQAEWKGLPAPVFAYQWLREGIAIPQATAISYTVVEADQTHQLSCRVTAKNSEGTGEAPSTNSLRVPGSAPANTKLPEISGAAALGSTLSCSTGTWTGVPAPVFSYQWVRAGTAIPLAQTSTYTIVEADAGHALACEVTATNSEGKVAKTSEAVVVPGGGGGGRPVNTKAPEVSGAPSPGSTLTCARGTWTGTPTPEYAYSWLREGALITGAATSTYKVTEADAGYLLSCRVTATNSEGTSSALSRTLKVPGAKPEDRTAPTVPSKAAVGEAITCSPGEWKGAPAPTFTYQWLREGALISTGPVYVPVTEDVGHTLNCKVTGHNSEGQGVASSSTTRVTGSAPQNTIPPEVSGAPTIGGTLTCSTGTWTGNPAPKFAYAWLREGAVIQGAGASTYQVTEADAGNSLSCKVTATSSEGTGSQSSANMLKVPGLAPEDRTAPTLAGKAVVGETLTCVPGEWVGAPVPTLTYKWLLEGTAVASGQSYVLVAEDENRTIACEVTAVNVEGHRSAGSAPVRVSGSAPENVTPPQVSGTAAAGAMLTCSQGTWMGTPTPEYKYAWLRDGLVLPGATTSAYTVAAADETHSLSCRVTAVNSEGTRQAESNTLHIAGAKPASVSPPAIAGSAVVGETLTCLPGEWLGTPTPELSYEWLLEGAPIRTAGGANSFVVPAEDAGRSLACAVTATNSEGHSSASSGSVKVIGSPPEDAKPPEVTVENGGSKLSCSGGEWGGAPAPTLRWQWLRVEGNSLEPIPGAVAGVYTVVEADRARSLVCRVTARNIEGVNSADSEPVQIAGVAPEPLAPPEVSGAPVVGETLSCSPGTWSGQPAPSFNYEWLLGGTVELARGTSVVVTAQDRGLTLSCRVTAHNSAGTAPPALSASVMIPGIAPEKTEAPTVKSSRIIEGETPKEELTCLAGEWTGQPQPLLTFQWLREGAPIESATEGMYIVGPLDRGHRISCEVIATNSAGQESATSETVHVAGLAPVDLEAPKVSGEPQAGERLKCSPGSWEAAPAPAFEYQWLLDGGAIASATSSTYVTESAQLGHSISCVVTARNSEGSTKLASSNSTLITPRVVRKLEVAKPVPKSSSLGRTTQPTVAQLLATLSSQLTTALHHARITQLLKPAGYAFSFLAPSAGTLEVFWYGTPKGAHKSAKSKPILVASAVTSFTSATTVAVTLRLTRAGRQLIRRSKKIKLTAKGVFVGRAKASATWQKTFVLSR